MSVSAQYILDHIDEAIDNGCIRALFQPVMRTLTGRICCAEALARWDDPENGMLSPAAFIPVLERHERIYRLDMTILQQTCMLYRKLQDTEAPVHSFSVNFSRSDFSVPHFFEDVVNTLRAFQVPHAAIKMEVTESVMFADQERFHSVFNAFRDAGFDVWIDDFGSGYSSLSMLHEYSFSLLKIDMLFIQSFTLRSRQLIAAIVNAGKALGIRTLIEGVETEEQMRFVKSIGCETIQGFYYSKPLDEKTFTAYLSPDNTEPLAEKEYWNTVGSFNLLSPNPMEDRNGAAAFQSDSPLALIECTWGQGEYIYVNDAYMESVHSLGFDSIQDLELFFNAKLSTRYHSMQNMLTEAVMTETIQETEYVSGQVFYKFRAKCIAKSRELQKAMVVASLSTFKEDRELREQTDVVRYGRLLYASYEHVNVVFPDKDSSIRVFSNANFQTAHQLMPLRDGIRSFCEKEVHPDDRSRYLRFFDLDKLDAHTSETGFIQQGFRILDSGRGYRWRQVRITRASLAAENIYIYTIQRMSDVSVKIAEMLLKDHPELLE